MKNLRISLLCTQNTFFHRSNFMVFRGFVASPQKPIQFLVSSFASLIVTVFLWRRHLSFFLRILGTHLVLLLSIFQNSSNYMWESIQIGLYGQKSTDALT